MLGFPHGLEQLLVEAQRPGVALELEYRDEAVAGAEGAARWYAERSSSAAIRFSLEFDEAEAAILNRPEAWPAIGERNRHYLLRRFPFSVV